MTEEIRIAFPEDQLTTLTNMLQLIVVAGLEFHGTGNAVPTKTQLEPIWKTIINAMVKRAQGLDTELEFLRYFYDKVRPCLGPADSEVIDMIKEGFQKTGNKLPNGYDKEE